MSSHPVRSHAVNRLPALAGPAAWNAILGPQAARPALEGPRTADVVIIGAGFGGLSAARRLHQLQPRARVIVLDASRIAESSSGRNSGFMIDLPHDLASDDYAGSGDDRAVIAVNRHGIAFAREAVAEYGIDRNYFDPVGKVNGAVSAKATICDACSKRASRPSSLTSPLSILTGSQGSSSRLTLFVIVF